MSAGAPARDREDSRDEVASQPRRLGRYVLRKHLAAGGMGEVYLAELRGDGGFRKAVALKLIHHEVARSPKFQEMFRREARLAALVVDPHVCQVFDFGETEGTCFLAMEHLHGQALSTVAERAARRGGLSPVLAARIVADAARGLHAMHTVRDPRGEGLIVVHRDVSPQNIFVLYSGSSKVLDFGIARPAEREGEFTRTGEIKGKPAYLAPEQARGEPITPQVDLWALGVVLWEVTLGRRLFRRNSDAESLAAVLSDAVPPPTKVRPGYPPELEAVILRALQREPAARYASGLEMARALERFIAQAVGSDGRDAVAEHLAAHFAAERENQETVLHTAHVSLTPPSATPKTDPDARTVPSMPRAAAPTPPGRSRKALGVAAVVGLVALGLVAGYAVRPRPSAAVAARPPTTEPPATPATPTPTALPPMAAPMPPSTPTPEAAPVAPASPHAAPRRPGHGLRPAGPTEHPVERPTERPTERPVETVPGTGHLTLNAPPATVFLGTRRLGRTPLYGVMLPAGEHTIRVVPEDGTPEQEATVTVETGATTALRMRW